MPVSDRAIIPDGGGGGSFGPGTRMPPRPGARQIMHGVQQRFNVTKINRKGHSQLRCIEVVGGTLRNTARDGALKKELPLAELRCLERSINDRRALSLAWTTGTAYALIFADALEREAFADLVQEQCATFWDEEDDAAYERGSVGASVREGLVGFDDDDDDVAPEVAERAAAPPAKKATRRSTALLQGVVGSSVNALPIKIFVATFNVGNTMPPEDLSPWLQPPGEVFSPPDLYVVAAQECSYSVKTEMPGSADE